MNNKTTVDIDKITINLATFYSSKYINITLIQKLSMDFRVL